MRSNPVKEKLARGETAFGTMVFEFANPGTATVLAGAGAEYVIYDMEHSGISEEEIKRQIAYCRGQDIVPLVRPPDKSYATTARLLDIGSMGLVYQMVESREEAETIVSWARYPPRGLRGAMFGGAHDDYSGGNVSAKIAGAEARTMVIALIETAKGVEAVDEILAVRGIDAAYVGHYDLSLTMGIPGEFDHPDFDA
ncbi:MAG: aldolase/citrate lyase family protein, partial [Alphaproteobacteria bacterium]|nr:aldolase/citrate lyase family protein [Alphaproteobacteria bacterium]